jgi:hypothetical protein
MAELIAQTEHCDLLHVPGTADVTLLVFGQRDAESWSGATAAELAGIEMFYIRPRGLDEATSEDVQGLLQALQARRDPARVLATLGGGAALRHARVVGATLVLTFAPRIRTAPMLPRGCDVFLFADAGSTRPSWPGAYFVGVPGLADDPDLLFATPDRLAQLLKLARGEGSASRRAAALGAWGVRIWRTSSAYLSDLLVRVHARGHRRWVRDLLPRVEAAGALGPDGLLIRAASRQQAGDVAGAIDDLRATMAVLPSTDVATALAVLLAEQGELGAARLAIGDAADGGVVPEAVVEVLRSRAQPVMPASGDAMARAEAAGDAGLAAAAVRAAPGEAGVLMRYGRLLHRLGARAQAHAALEAAVLSDRDGALANGFLAAPAVRRRGK